MEEDGGCSVVVDVGVGYPEVVGYGVAALGCGVEVGIEGVEVGMPSACSEDVGIGVECRFPAAVSGCCDAAGSDLIG